VRLFNLNIFYAPMFIYTSSGQMMLEFPVFYIQIRHVICDFLKKNTDGQCGRMQAVCSVLGGIGTFNKLSRCMVILFISTFLQCLCLIRSVGLSSDGSFNRD
jgi:hypothetical protein